MRDRAKLTITEEKQILALNGLKTQKEVATQFNISTVTLRNVCNRNGVRWAWQQRNQDGENNHNYKDGLGKSTIERLTNAVLTKAGRNLFKCERCDSVDKDKEQHRHHKDRDRSNNTPENLEVLCPTCHRLEHEQDMTRNEKGQYVS